MEYSSSTDVLQAYRLATDIAKSSNNIDDEIEAYRKVIELGQNSENIAPDDLLKYNMIMYWAHNNLADALVTKSYHNALESTNQKEFAKSLEYYQQGLKFAQDNLEKITVLNRMADSYLQLNDEQGLCDMKHKFFAHLNNEDKRRAYFDLASRLKNSLLAAEMYEEALNFVNDEKVSLHEKCRQTIEICEKLEAIYLQNNDHQNYLRILKLKGNAENILDACIKKGGCKV